MTPHHIGFFLIVCCMLIAGSISLLIRRLCPLRILQAHHEVAFPIFLQIGVIYAMRLSLVFSVSWDGFRKTQDDVEMEAASLITLVHLSQGLSNPTRQQIQQGIVQYIQSIVSREWEVMKSQREDMVTWQLLNNIEKIYLNFQPQNAVENTIYAESLHRLSDARTYRRIRIFQVTQPRPVALWVMLSVMGITVTGISYLFGMEYLWSQAALTAILAGMIGVIILVVVVLERPYSGFLPMVRPKVFEDALQKIDLIVKN
jgi:hypothetical protein